MHNSEIAQEQWKKYLPDQGVVSSSNLHMESTYSYGYVPFRKRSSWWGSVVVWFMADFGVAATSLSKDALRNCNESMNRNRFHEKDRYRSMFCAITDTYKTKKESITRQHLTHIFHLHTFLSVNLLLQTVLTFYSPLQKSVLWLSYKRCWKVWKKRDGQGSSSFVVATINTDLPLQ